MNDREREIFEIIIKHYLHSGESVGSRTLEKKYNIGFSSATIRNVMSDLEEMGLITKTHTSSGRIPTLEGYKTYIDELLDVSEINEEIKSQIFNTFEKRINKTDAIFLETVKLLSELSGGLAVALEPTSGDESIKKIQFVRITSRDVFVVAVMRNNIVKTSVLSMKTYVNDENIDNLTLYINNLINTTHKDFTLKDLESFLKTIGETDMNVENNKIFEKNKIFIDGVVNLISNTDMEISDVVKTLNVVNSTDALKEIFKNLAIDVEYDISRAHIVFGKDLNIESLEDYVIIFKCYEFGNQKGMLGIISQTRMDYSKNISIIESIIPMLKRILNQNTENKFLDYKN